MLFSDQQGNLYRVANGEVPAGMAIAPQQAMALPPGLSMPMSMPQLSQYPPGTQVMQQMGGQQVQPQMMGGSQPLQQMLAAQPMQMWPGQQVGGLPCV